MTGKILPLQGYFLTRTYIRNFIYVVHRQSSKTFHVALMKLYMHFVLLLVPRSVTLTSSNIVFMLNFLEICHKKIFCIFISVELILLFTNSPDFFSDTNFLPNSFFLSLWNISFNVSAMLWVTTHMYANMKAHHWVKRVEKKVKW